MLSTLFFDVGGVLLTNGWDRAERARAAARFGLDPARLERRHTPLIEPLECGVLSLDDYLDKAVFDEPRPFPRAEFIAFMQSCSQPMADSLAMLPELAPRFRLATLNNEGRDLNDYRIERFDLRQYFSAFCSSCYLGARKPGPEIFERALGILHLRPEDCGFVDDRLENLATPRALGLTCFLFTTPAQLRQDLCLD
ncbi:MAG: HAD-IA family hydrolase [Terriglobales bacterium]